MMMMHLRSWTTGVFYALGLILLSAAVAAGQQTTGDAAPEPVSQASEPTGQGESAEQASLAAKPFDLWTTKHLTGDWGGLRTSLVDEGLSFRLVYNQQYMVNVHGGLESKNGNDFAGSYELNIEADFEKMNLLPGASFFIRAAKGTWGGEDSDFDHEKIGGLFKTNADASTEEPIYVDKWWYRQRFLDDRVEFRLGMLLTKKDLFDRSKIAGSEDKNFLNAALVSNPTIPHKQGLGAYVNVWPNDWLYFRAAVVDTDARKRRTGFDTAFHGRTRARVFWEIGAKPTLQTAKGGMPGHYRVGSWYYPLAKRVYRNSFGGVLPDRFRNGDVGFYLGAEQMIWKESGEAKDKQGCSLFARYGYAHGDLNRIEHFWSGGVQYVGLVPTREKDTLAFGIAQGILSEKYRLAGHARADRETVYELYYKYYLAPWLIISPDIQFVTNPGGDKGDRDAFITGLRLRIVL